MPLDEATTRFAFLMQRDLRRFVEREQAHTAKGQSLTYDSVSRVATFETRGGDVVSRHYGEPLARYSTDERIFRWGWAGRGASADPTHVDVVFREGQARGVPQLAMSLVADVSEDDATTLARLGALVARARSMLVRRSGSDVEYVGLFDRTRPVDPAQLESARGARAGAGAHADRDEDAGADPSGDRFSVPPPPVAPTERKATPAPRRAPYRSLPPIREVWEPRTGSRPPSKPPQAARPSVREPARELFLPVAAAALGALSRGAPGYKQGLFGVTVDAQPDGKRRIVVQLVALDALGLLRAIDPPTELVEAAAKMIDADRASGNGPWRKLSARITPKPDGGATLNVDVV
jgi:hypothetical protein